MGEEERGPYLTLGESADAYAQDAGMSDAEARAEHGYARADELERLGANAAALAERIVELERENAQLKEQLRRAGERLVALERSNLLRRDENESLRRLLVAVLPPEALYQEALTLVRTLRNTGF